MFFIPTQLTSLRSHDEMRDFFSERVYRRVTRTLPEERYVTMSTDHMLSLQEQGHMVLPHTHTHIALSQIQTAADVTRELLGAEGPPRGAHPTAVSGFRVPVRNRARGRRICVCARSPGLPRYFHRPQRREHSSDFDAQSVPRLPAPPLRPRTRAQRHVRRVGSRVRAQDAPPTTAGGASGDSAAGRRRDLQRPRERRAHNALPRARDPGSPRSSDSSSSTAATRSTAVVRSALRAWWKHGGASYTAWRAWLNVEPRIRRRPPAPTYHRSLQELDSSFVFGWSMCRRSTVTRRYAPSMNLGSISAYRLGIGSSAHTSSACLVWA